MVAIVFALAIMTILSAGAAKANMEEADYRHFRKIPILHEGRLKPLESFAAIHYRWFQGDAGIQKDRAVDWLAKMVFEPSLAAFLPVFEVQNPALDDAIFKKLKDDDDDRLRDDAEPLYSMAQLTVFFQGQEARLNKIAGMAQAERSEYAQSLYQLSEKYQTALSISASLSLFLPLDLQISEMAVKRYAPVDDYFENAKSFMDLSAYEPAFREALMAIIQDKGDDIQSFDEGEQSLAQLVFSIDQIMAGGKRAQLFKILPAYWEGQDLYQKNWLSPWGQYLSGQGHPKHARYLEQWQGMIKAFRSGDRLAFETHSQQALDMVLGRHAGAQDGFEEAQNSVDQLAFQLNVEILYNHLRPTNKAMIFYVMALLFMAGFWVGHPTRQKWRYTTKMLAWGFAIAGGFMQLLAIIIRMILLARPPVTTLYESILFVAAIAFWFAFFLYQRNERDLIYLALGSAAALILSVISSVFLVEQDSLQMLVAVLNTNFWLATHVLIITAGYGLCILTAFLAHGWFIRKIIYQKRGLRPEKRDPLWRITYFMAVFALLLTSVGTILGGIWADQSWGRFWGWDPKENGALLIVLWLAWLIHGRFSGAMGKKALTAGFTYLNVIVGLAWFGVNLLGVGLHSYGFTSGIALGLIGFIILQTIVTAGLWGGYHFLETKKGLGDQS